MKRLLTGLAAAVVAALALAAASSGISWGVTTSTGTALLTGVKLWDSGSVMQSFTRTNPTNGTYFFTQAMQDGRLGESHTYHLEHGDLTLTHVSSDGLTIMSHMYLQGFGHGEAISVQDAHPGVWVYIEAVSVQGPTSFPDGFGTEIARFMWVANATITPYSSGVQLYNPHPGSYHDSVSLDLPDDLIAARWMTADSQSYYAVYRLTDFLARSYVPLWVIPEPPAPGTGQGWGLMPGGQSIAWLTGDPYSSTNPPPGNTLLTVFDQSGITSQELLGDATGLTWREPEGVQPTSTVTGKVCDGWASGPSTARVANLYCRPLP